MNPIDILLGICCTILALAFGGMFVIMTIVVIREAIEQRKRNRR